MQKRKFDELISHFSRKVADMSIDQKYKIELLGMISAIGFENEKELTAHPEIIYCKDCKYWNSGSCECHEYVVNNQDYMVGDIETEAEHFCGYADMREVTT